MGRWTGLSSLIDFNFEHGHVSYRNGLPSANLTTKYRKLDDSVFVLCRNCGQSLKTEDPNKMAPNVRPKANPKHFLTWSATAANSRIQKMSKNFVNNFSRLQQKVEKAIPFQPGAGEFTSSTTCSSESCSSTKRTNPDKPLNRDIANCGGSDTNICGIDNNNFTPCEELTQLKVRGSSVSANKNGILRSSTFGTTNANISPTANLIASIVKQCEEIGSYKNNNHQNSRLVQNARIVQSHPSVSQTPSQVANNHSNTSANNSSNEMTDDSDKIIQINFVDPEGPKTLSNDVYKKSTRDKHHSVKMFQGLDNRIQDTNSVIEMQSLDPDASSRELCYDSGTGSANTSMSDSSLSTVATLPISSPAWSRASSISSSAVGSNLNSSSPSPNQPQQQKNQRCDNKGKPKSPNNAGPISSNRGNCSSSTKSSGQQIKGILKSQAAVVAVESNSNNCYGVPITESTDERSLLIDNNKSNQRKGGLKKHASSGSCRNVEICNNNKNLVPTNKEGRNKSCVDPLDKIKYQKLSSAYPPSKLAVTIFEEEAELRHAPWFQAGIPREIALEVLKNEPIGSFIVRESTTKSGCFALSLRVPQQFQPNGIAHYLILKTSRGYKIKGFTKEFGSLGSLITHHSVMAELLPCPLSLHRYRPKHPLRVSRMNSSDFMEPEKLISCRTFMDF